MWQPPRIAEEKKQYPALISLTFLQWTEIIIFFYNHISGTVKKTKQGAKK